MVNTRMVILDRDANIITYPSYGGMHHECLEDFANRHGYEYSEPSYLASQGNVIFYNVGNGMLGAYFPKKLTDEQLYQLDYLENWLDDSSYFNAVKGNGEETEEFLFEDNVKERFSNELIQSYYKKRKKR